VALRGRVVPLPAGQPHGPSTTTGERDTVRVLFEPPVLSLGDALHFRIGEAEHEYGRYQQQAGRHVWLETAPTVCTIAGMA